MKTTAFLAALFLSAAALAAPSDNWITFGLDHGKYLDGETIAEGEEFSLDAWFKNTPQGVKVYPGHGDATTIGEERARYRL